MFVLTVVVPDATTFEAYDYGYGQVTHIEPFETGSVKRTPWLRYTVLYDESFYAEYQAARFASGLYFAEVVDTVKDA